MGCALFTAGGKDATWALHRARAQGRPVTHAVNIYDLKTSRVRFHGTPIELIRAQADALELELIERACGPGDFEAAFRSALEELKGRGVKGVVFGNIHLEDVRSWYEERTSGMGLEHIEPLWRCSVAELCRDIVALVYRPVVVSVDLDAGSRDWLGREITLSLLDEFGAAGIDLCGEHGEYHTFVWDGPDFRNPVRIELGEAREAEGHAFIDVRLG